MSQEEMLKELDKLIQEEKKLCSPTPLTKEEEECAILFFNTKEDFSDDIDYQEALNEERYLERLRLQKETMDLNGSDLVPYLKMVG